MLQTIILYKLYNKLLPLGTINLIKDTMARINHIKTVRYQIWYDKILEETNGDVAYSQGVASGKVIEHTDAIKNNIKYMLIQKALLFGMVALTQRYAKDNAVLAGIIGAVTGALIGYTIVLHAKEWIDTFKGAAPLAIAGIIGGTAILMGIFNAAMSKSMAPPDNSEWTKDLSTDEEFAFGGRVMYPRTGYATGGRIGGNDGNHFPVMVESGETIVSKTKNMARGTGGASGITIQIHGDVYDGDNFAEKIGQALPNALRGINDIGGM